MDQDLHTIENDVPLVNDCHILLNLGEFVFVVVEEVLELHRLGSLIVGARAEDNGGGGA